VLSQEDIYMSTTVMLDVLSVIMSAVDVSSCSDLIRGLMEGKRRKLK
jgi:hypothetical protein